MKVRLGVVMVIGAMAAGLVLATPGFAGFKPGTYTGTSSQAGQNLQLQVNKKRTKVNVVFFEFDAPPCGGVGGLQYAGLQAKIKPSGKFNAPSPGDGFYGYVKGKFNGRKASGTARYHFDASGCESGVVDWTAHKAS
jgi:hypothetical protein